MSGRAREYRSIEAVGWELLENKLVAKYLHHDKSGKEIIETGDLENLLGVDIIGQRELDRLLASFARVVRIPSEDLESGDIEYIGTTFFEKIGFIGYKDGTYRIELKVSDKAEKYFLTAKDEETLKKRLRSMCRGVGL